MKKRLRNYGMWVALGSLIIDGLIYMHYINIPADVLEHGLQRLLEILVMLGIVSNPTNPEGKGFNL